MTQAAVSKQIAGFEAHLGTRLFSSNHRSVSLTREGRELNIVVHLALKDIAAAARAIAGPQETHLTIALSTTLSQFWLMPRLNDFTASNPDLSVRVISQDSPVNLAANEADVAVRFGDGHWADGTSVPLFTAQVRPMATEAFLRRHNVRTPEDLERIPLIQYDTPDSSWVSWDDWLVATGLRGLRLRPALSFTRFQDAIAAAWRGQGVVLDWFGLPDEARFSPSPMVPAPGAAITPPGSFFLVAADPKRGAVARFIDWAS